MWVKTEIEEGIVTKEDIEEFAEMFQSGWYTQKEIAEWFGISIAKFKTWIKVAQERGLIPYAKVDRCRSHRWRAHQSEVR
jgi:transposase